MRIRPIVDTVCHQGDNPERSRSIVLALGKIDGEPPKADLDLSKFAPGRHELVNRALKRSGNRTLVRLLHGRSTRHEHRDFNSIPLEVPTKRAESAGSAHLKWPIIAVGRSRFAAASTAVVRAQVNPCTGGGLGWWPHAAGNCGAHWGAPVTQRAAKSQVEQSEDPITRIDPFMELRGFAPNTVAVYRRSARRFLRVVGKSPDEVTERHTEEYRLGLRTQGSSPTTRNVNSVDGPGPSRH